MTSEKRGDDYDSLYMHYLFWLCYLALRSWAGAEERAVCFTSSFVLLVRDSVVRYTVDAISQGRQKRGGDKSCRK